tara:strand:- start:41164 stop:43074 length:1911 start_codon:yes stop_codon:yes gene_type:complete
MLQAMREKAQGWIAWVIVVLIALTFILFWGGGSFFTPAGDQSKTVAKVNGEEISLSMLEKQYEQLLRQPNSNLKHLSPNAIKAKILDSIIDETLITQGAKDLGLKVSEHRIDSQIRALPIFHENGVFSINQYKRFLMNMNLSERELKEMFTKQLLQQQLYSALASTSFVIEPDFNAFMNYFFQKRSYRYTKVERQKFADTIKVSDDEVNEFYEANTQDFYTPEKVSLEYVALNLEEVKNSYTPEPDQIKQYYNENKALFNEPERRSLAHIYIQVANDASEEEISDADKKIKAIYQRLTKGESFEDLAKSESDDVQTKNKGGSLDWIVRGEIGIPAFEAVAFNLEKGKYSEPTRTDFGFHIIKLLDLTEEKVLAFDEVKDKVTAQLQTRWAEDEIINRIDKLTNLSYDYPDTLQPIVDEMGLTVEKTALFTQENPENIKELNTPKVVEVAFSEYVKDQGNNSDLIQLDDQNYVVFRIAERVPSALKPLSEVKASIQSLLVYQKSSDQAELAAKAILDKLKSNTVEEDKLISEFAWQESKNITLTSTEEDRYILDTVFKLARPSQKTGVSAEVTQLVNSDYAVVWLTDVENGKLNDAKPEEIAQLKEHVLRQAGELDFTLYTKSLEQKAKIKREDFTS